MTLLEALQQAFQYREATEEENKQHYEQQIRRRVSSATSHNANW
jgi:hypothetical protein